MKFSRGGVARQGRGALQYDTARRHGSTSEYQSRASQDWSVFLVSIGETKGGSSSTEAPKTVRRHWVGPGALNARRNVGARAWGWPEK